MAGLAEPCRLTAGETVARQLPSDNHSGVPSQAWIRNSRKGRSDYDYDYDYEHEHEHANEGRLFMRRPLVRVMAVDLQISRKVAEPAKVVLAIFAPLRETPFEAVQITLTRVRD